MTRFHVLVLQALWIIIRNQCKFAQYLTGSDEIMFRKHAKDYASAVGENDPMFFIE